MADISQVTLPDNNTYDIKAKELASQSKTISNVAIASFSDGADNVPVSSLIVGIEPIQDLHGQASPYPAGGSAQRWDEAWESGSFNANGEKVSDANKIRSKNYISINPNTSYFIVCPSTSKNGFALFYDNNKTYISGAWFYGNAPTTSPANAYYMMFRMVDAYGTTYNNDISINYPSTDTSYHPYSNICPILGWNGCDISRCGTNIWDGDFESGKFNISTGAEVSDSNFIRSKNFIKVKPDTVGYVKFDNPQFIALFYDENKTYTTHYSALGSGGGYISIPSDAHYMKFYSQESTNQNDISINYPTETDEDYHAYVGSKYQTYFEGLIAGTYGFVDLGSLTWTKLAGYPEFRANYSMNDIPVGKNQPGNVKSNLICTIYPAMTTNETYRGANTGVSLTNLYISVGDDTYSDADAFTEAMSGVYLIYELATPTTPSITQENINMLVSEFNADLVCVVFGQEVYDGSLNVSTGLMTITHGYIDLGVQTWFSGGGNFYDTADIGAESSTMDIISTSYPCESSAYFENHPNIVGLSISASRKVRFYNSDATSPSDVQTLLNGCYLCYKLETPTEITLTPTEVRTLLEDNNIFADTGDINKLVYFKTGCKSITDIINVMHDDSKMSYSNAYGKKTCNQLTDPGIYYNIDTTGSPAEGYSMTTLITTYNCQILVYLGLVVNIRRVNHAPGGTITFSPWKRLANEDDLDGAVIPYNAEYSTTNTIYDEIEALKSPSAQTVTLAANSWNSSTHLITVSVAGVTATSVQDVIGLPATSSANISNNEALQNANIMDAGQSSGTLTFYAENVPTTDLQIRVIVRG